jgi:hypothetical protein
MFHITVRSDGGDRLFPEEDQLLGATRAVARIGGRHQLLFNVADNHGHSVVDGDAKTARYVAASLRRVLARLPGGRPLEPARIKPVNGRSHLENLVPYVLTQTAHHGLAKHPAAWIGSCLPDLVGARILPGFDRTRLEAALPRYPLDEAALLTVGLDFPLPHPDREALRALGATRLWRAAGAAVGVEEPVRKHPIEVAARVVYVALAKEAGIVDREARETAKIARSAWYRLAEVAPDGRLLAVVRQQLALQHAIAAPNAPSRAAFRQSSRERESRLSPR